MSIDTKSVFCDVAKDIKITTSDFNFVTFLECAENLAKSRYSPTKQALANARGAWFAWLFQIGCETLLEHQETEFFTLKLPNTTGFPFIRLYNPELRRLISDFESKLDRIASVNLVTSNPDFAVLRAKPGFPRLKFPVEITQETLREVDEFYRNFESTLDINELIAFIGLKTSLRPDRRIQLLHEGSLVKALHTHLKTRNWDIDAKPLKYFGVSLEVSDADIEGLRSVATHSIVSASLIPERAVDAIVNVQTLEDLRRFLKLLSR